MKSTKVLSHSESSFGGRSKLILIHPTSAIIPPETPSLPLSMGSSKIASFLQISNTEKKNQKRHKYFQTALTYSILYVAITQ